MWNRGKGLHWGLDVVEDCSDAYSVNPSTIIHPRCRLARYGLILLVTRSDAEHVLRTGLLFPQVRSTESRIILPSPSQHRMPQDSWFSQRLEPLVDRSAIYTRISTGMRWKDKWLIPPLCAASFRCLVYAWFLTSRRWVYTALRRIG